MMTGQLESVKEHEVQKEEANAISELQLADTTEKIGFQPSIKTVGSVQRKESNGRIEASGPSSGTAQSAAPDVSLVNPYLHRRYGHEGSIHAGSSHGPRHGEESMHGAQAAKRRAITDILFFASVGDLTRCMKIFEMMKIDVGDKSCCDYDKRTPLHLAASEGVVKLTQWLLENGAEVNALDRFNRTPLEEACRGRFTEVIKLMLPLNAKVYEKGKLVPLQDSRLAGILNMQEVGVGGLEGFELDPEWEIEPRTIELLDRLGEGSFGTVFRGRYRGTIVAVKVLNKETDVALGDFRTEIGTLKKISHPNAVQFLGAVTKQKPYMLVMEYMAGGSLADAIRKRLDLPLPRIVEIALDFARGMAYLHSEAKAIIHRDLKPNNLLIGGVASLEATELVRRAGTVKISDFGLSKSLPIFDRQLKDTYQLTGGTGSFRYMSPEVFRHTPYNYKVDVYSFGMILYQMIEMRAPFDGHDPIQAAFMAESGRRPNFQAAHVLPNGPELMRLVESCWHDDPERRPSFEEIIGKLERVQRELDLKEKVGSSRDAGQKSKGFLSFLRGPSAR